MMNCGILGLVYNNRLHVRQPFHPRKPVPDERQIWMLTFARLTASTLSACSQWASLGLHNPAVVRSHPANSSPRAETAPQSGSPTVRPVPSSRISSYCVVSMLPRFGGRLLQWAAAASRQHLSRTLALERSPS